MDHLKRDSISLTFCNASKFTDKDRAKLLLPVYLLAHPLWSQSYMEVVPARHETRE